MSGKTPQVVQKYNDYFKNHGGWDQFFFWSFVVVGLFNLYVWLVALVSLCAGSSLTSWLLPLNVFWYVVAGGAAYLLILLIAVFYYFFRCVYNSKPANLLGGIRAGRWISYAFFGLFVYVLFFVLTLTFANFYDLFDGTIVVDRSSASPSSVFATITSPYGPAVAAAINSNFALADVAAVGEALGNWFANLVIILIGTTLVFLVTLMIVISPWNSKADVIEMIYKEKAQTSKARLNNKA